ncbi:hypothetical protein BGW80DRAFT_1302058 [Lactifluus volemus]|nr:hypothetical protein BGW80DRAFT_1302058 [Lactifluus volemus]
MPCGRTSGTRRGRYHRRRLIERFENLVAMFHLGLVFRATILSMGAGASHVAKKGKNMDGEKDEDFWSVGFCVFTSRFLFDWSVILFVAFTLTNKLHYAPVAWPSCTLHV